MSAGESHMTIGEPQKHTSAQLLIQICPPKCTGFLRKRGKRERVLENIKFAKTFFSRLLQWRQRFVVVSHGCIYVYVSETASKPVTSFSLKGYNKLHIMESEQSQWSFRITAPHAYAKMHYFACHADDDRKKWMAAIREEMLLANDLQDDRASAGSVGSNFYEYVQTPIFDTPAVAEGDSDADSQDSDYDKINDDELEKLKRRPVMPLPPTPTDGADAQYKMPVKKEVKIKSDTNNHDYVNKPKPKKQKPPPTSNEKPKPATKPKPALKPQLSPTTPTEDQYFFPENDRNKALTVLRNIKEPGAYLVRNSRAGDTKVLAVYTEDDIKEYKILSKNNKFTINNKDFFKSVNDLVAAHQTTPLPNRSTTLTRAFSTQDISSF